MISGVYASDMVGTAYALALMSIWVNTNPDLCLSPAQATMPRLSHPPVPGDRSLNLYVGIDIAKASHVASLLSNDLLFRYHRYEACPVFSFDNSRAGFEHLFSSLRKHCPAGQCHVLLENTGHYGRALEQYLQEHGIVVYRVHVQEKRGPKKNKSDKLDAKALAVLLYNQVERGTLVADKSQMVHRLTVPNDTARLLRGLVQHRQELVRETTRRKNKLTAIADEIFPELTQIYKKPNKPAALALRKAFPTPQAILQARIEDLYTTRTRNRPSNKQFAQLRDLAAQTIGTKDKSRLTALLIEQEQLIVELKLLQSHIDALQLKIEATVAASREGQILTSFPIIGTTQAAQLIAAIGSIANFPSAAKLRAYCGWSPLQAQTGTTMDSMVLEKAGNRLLKDTILLITWSAIRQDTPWRTLYNRLVPVKCVYDERLKRYRGRMKVIGRIAGQIIGLIWLLLKRDHDIVTSTPAGEEPPPPQLYDPNKHHVKRN